MPIKLGIILTFTVLFGMALTIHAQRRSIPNLFDAGLVIGINSSQINGDYLSGYDKTGFLVGFRVEARFNNSSGLAMEMLFNRKGSRDPNQFVPGSDQQRFISMNYVEIPILYHKRVEAKIGLISIEGGVSYARLFGTNINENANSINYDGFTDIQNEFKNNDLSLLLGGGIYFNEHLRMIGRFAYSLTLFYKNEEPEIIPLDVIPEINKLRNVQLALGMNYIF